MTTPSHPTTRRQRAALLAGLAVGLAVAASAQVAAGSAPDGPPDAITTDRAAAIALEERAAAAGTAASGALADGLVTASEHRAATDAALRCLERAADDRGLELSVLGPRSSPDGARLDYAYRVRRGVGSAAAPDLERACRAEHLDHVERARLARLRADVGAVAASRAAFDDCVRDAGLGEHLDDTAPAPEVARRAMAADAPVDVVGSCAAGSPLLFEAPTAARGGAGS